MTTIKSALQSGRLEITLDNPQHGNSFGLNEAEQLNAVLEAQDLKNLKGLVFSSSPGRLFCSGGNLHFYGEMDQRSEGIEANRVIRQVLGRLAKLPLPTVALVDGDCFGGGVELVSCFDRVYSAPHSFFGFWQRRIGLTFGWGGGQRLLERLPLHQLKLLALEARSIGASEARALGLIDGVLPAYRLQEAAEDWLESCSRWPKAPVTGLKNLSQEGEVELFEGLWFNEEHQRVLKKFTGK